jgi:tetratricopeptide (TPR) repeat protein
MHGGARYDALVQRGLEAMRDGRPADAEAAFAQIASDNPKEHRAWHMLAVIALNAARPHDAVGFAQRAVQHDRRNPAYHSTLGIAAAECGMLDDALGHFRRALREKPGFVDASYNLGKTLVKIGDLKGAHDAYRRALAFDARHPGLRKNLAWVLRELSRLDEAIALLEVASAESPGDEDLLEHLADAYGERSGSGAALASYGAAIERLPTSALLHFGRAQLLLSRGEWRAGWSEYLWRDLVPRTPPSESVARPLGRRDPPPLPQPGSLARDLSGVHLRLIGEQGLGDALFFTRFAPELKRRGASLVLECQPKLVPLLGRSPLFDEVRPFDAAGSAGTAGGSGVFLGDLPALLDAQTTPPPLPLTADSARVARCRETLARHGEPPFIGVTWRAGTDPREPEFGRRLDALSKQIAPETLAAALHGISGTLFVLQRRPRPEELAALARRLGRTPPDLSAFNEDLEEMAALLAALDDYVGVSNTNMHLAAGVGRPARVLVPYPPEWRWMDAGDESPWFPGFRVYRQSVTRSWDEALACLRAELLAAGGP